MMGIIRLEIPEDIPDITRINNQAFQQTNEGQLIERIRISGSKYLSLVAINNSKIVGHIFFSPATIDGADIPGMALGPMAVLPKFQKKGIGSQLIREGLKRLKEANYQFVIVLGHPDYYPKFGFKAASTFGLKCQWENIPDNVFMAILLDKTSTEKLKGIVRYHKEFEVL